MKYIPERTCLGCNQKKGKEELIRIVKNKENNVLIDNTGKMQGRGAYICKELPCLEKVIKSKRIEKTLKIKIEEDFYNKLRGGIIE